METYFVAFRLAGSVSEKRAQRLFAQRQEVVRLLRSSQRPDALALIERAEWLFFQRFDKLCETNKASLLHHPTLYQAIIQQIHQQVAPCNMIAWKIHPNRIHLKIQAPSKHAARALAIRIKLYSAQIAYSLGFHDIWAAACFVHRLSRKDCQTVSFRRQSVI